MIFSRKINKIPEFYMIIALKYCSRFLFGGGGHVPPPQVVYAYEYTVSRKYATKLLSISSLSFDRFQSSFTGTLGAKFAIT